MKSETCWMTVGTEGDRSCERLHDVVQCSNCPSRMSQGRDLFERPVPPDYLKAWEDTLTSQREHGVRSHKGYLIFRLADDLLALEASHLSTIVSATSFHRLPNNTNPLVQGLASLQGTLHVVLSLPVLLQMDDIAAISDEMIRKKQGYYVVFTNKRRWTFHVDDILAVKRVEKGSLQDAPLTVERHRHTFSTKVLHYKNDVVAILDTDLLTHELSRRFG